MTAVLLLRHASPVLPGAPGFDEVSRPLTQQGARDARALAEQLSTRKIDALYSSPYRRAFETVEPLAVARGLAVTVVPDFREHQLSPEPIAHWREILSASWQDLDSAPGGGETLRATMLRGISALEALRVRHPSDTIAIGGHGTIFACMLHAFVPGVDCQFHLAMPMPAVYELSWGGGVWQVVSGPGINPLANAKVV